MNIGNYIAIYAAFVATAVFIWNIIRNRKYLKLTYYLTGEGDDFCVDVHVKNLTSRPLELKAILMGKYRRDYKFNGDDVCQIFCNWGRFKKNLSGKIGQIRVPLEENERVVFWINYKELREEHPAKEFPFNYICFADTNGNLYRYKIPYKIRKTLNTKS